jgi:hypothetical protein
MNESYQYQTEYNEIVKAFNYGEYEKAFELIGNLPDINVYGIYGRYRMPLLYVAAQMKDAVYLFHRMVIMGAKWKLPVYYDVGYTMDTSLLIAQTGNVELLHQLSKGMVCYENNKIMLHGMYVCIDSIFASPITEELMIFICSKNLVVTYVDSVNIYASDNFSKLLEQAVKNHALREGCCRIFAVMIDKCLINELNQAFVLACELWKSDDTFPIDIIINNKYLPDVKRKRKRYIVKQDHARRAMDRICDKISNEADSLRYLELYMFLRSKNVIPLCMFIFKIPNTSVVSYAVMEKFNCIIRTRYPNFLIEIQDVTLKTLVMRDTLTLHLFISPYMMGYFLIETFDSPISTISKRALQNSIMRPSRREISGSVSIYDIKKLLFAFQKKFPRKYPADEYIIKYLTEYSTFRDLYFFSDSSDRAIVKTLMTLHTTPGNVIHILPREILFMILLKIF